MLIALGILALIVAIIMPIFLNGFRNVNDLKIKIAADQLANAQIEMARESSKSCTDLQAFASTASDHFDQRMTVTKSTIVCPEIFPALIDFSVSVSVDSDEVSTINTQLLVTK